MHGMNADNVEILAPAGDMTCLQAALDAGADAVYFGLGEFNMRQRAGINFTVADLPEIRRRCEAARPGRTPVKRYLTLNSIIFEDEIEKADSLIAAAKPYIDAFIVADWGVVALCKKHGVPFHVSTQMSISNSTAVKFLKEQGATRVVLARECTLDEVGRIVRDGGYDNMCARTGVNGGLGDYYHDGDIGGGQYLNACVWFETILGQSCIGNTFRPEYGLSEDLITIFQKAAHDAVAQMKIEDGI
jgi:putative protease